jgi:pimeloyl-ACP methyl ester carboxylesterase
MATFVLVHGAFGGAHEFRLVRSRLVAEKHEVFTPALTGIGERSHLTGPQVTLRTHVEDVANLFEYWDLHDVVLLGFSYGGMVVTGALQEIADRVGHLVYLDALVPANGESLDSLVGRSRPRGLGAPWLQTPMERERSSHDDPGEEAFNAPRRTPQPVRTFSEEVVLSSPLEEYPFSRTYIKATGDPRQGDSPAWRAADHAKASPKWRYQEIATNHLIPSNRPDELAQILLEIAGGRGSLGAKT